jgi:hypothetical protein
MMNIKTHTIKRTAAIISATVFIVFSAKAADRFIDFSHGDVLVTNGITPYSIYIDKNDLEGVKIAVSNLQNDLKKVCSLQPTILNVPTKNTTIIIGTVGKSAMINHMMNDGKINRDELTGKREKYIIKEVDGKLIIAGSDKRGTIYGIYELSRQIGISPWYYWADVPIIKHKSIYAIKGTYTDGEPKVRYRGLFLNDEWPSLGGWAKLKFGGFNHQFYSRLFELILRMKGNFMWPAMWNNAFYADDALNGPTADKMGIIVGTSHHEPMCRSQKEWHNHTDNPNQESQEMKSRQDQNEYKWDYTVNAANLNKFWAGGVRRNKNTEDIVTVGMRGDGDMPMSEDQNVEQLQSIIENQRKIISKERGVNAKDVPQVWALYKEVQNYYNKGMQVPDDITLLLCDNNWGSLRMLPPLHSPKRSGGFGIYYHYDYVGGPRSYRWLNVSQIQRVWSDMNMAYENGVDRLWIVNVGDLKPMEYPIQFWFDMAWNPEKFNASNLYQHTVNFCESSFGKDNAEEAARILNLQCKYAYRVTPELLDKNTYSLENYHEFQTVINDYKKLQNEAEHQYASIQKQYKDAYMQLILYPIRAYTNLYQMYYAAAIGDSIGTVQHFHHDAELNKYYNDTLCGGKWKHFMDQTHIGYRSWNNPPRDIMPQVNKNVKKVSDVMQNVGNENDDVVSIEAEHFTKSQTTDNVKWTIIPYFGKTLSGVTLLPTNEPVGKSTLTYKFTTATTATSADIHLLIAPMLDYTCGDGIYYEVSIDDCAPVKVDVMGGRTNISEGFFDSRRIIDSHIKLPFNTNSETQHQVLIRPLSRGIILEKLIIDFGGMKKSYLGTPENIRK